MTRRKRRNFPSTTTENGAPAPWQTKPMSQEYFKNALQGGCKIENQTLEDIERETVDYISPDAKTDIELEISKM